MEEINAAVIDQSDINKSVINKSVIDHPGININIFGNEELEFMEYEEINGSNENYKSNAYDDNQHYKFKDLPCKIACISIDTQFIKIEMIYNLSEITEDEFIRFVDALKNNTLCSLDMRPGSNQEASISTKNGITSFDYSGAGGSSHVDNVIHIQNKYLVDVFSRMI